MKEQLEHRKEARRDMQFLNAQKIGNHGAEIEKIKSVFLAILRDIKKDMDSGEQPGETVTAAICCRICRGHWQRQAESFSVDDVTAMIVGQIGQFVSMNEETIDQFQQLVNKMTD